MLLEAINPMPVGINVPACLSESDQGDMNESNIDDPIFWSPSFEQQDLDDLDDNDSDVDSMTLIGPITIGLTFVLKLSRDRDSTAKPTVIYSFTKPSS